MTEQRASGLLTPALWRLNNLLKAVPEAERERILPALERVDLGMRDLIHDADQPITQVYFPLDCVISVVALLDGDTVVEVATVGPEGMAGLPVFLGATSSPNQSFCQVPGQALRLSVDALQGFLNRGSALHDILHRYTQALMVFLGQNVACNRLHGTEQRCARWLSHTHDRVGRDSFPLTQEFMAQMLGVRRATVSISARVLQHRGLIRYSRGRITVLDAEGLRVAACTCYQAIRREFAGL
jgi:CRP-like cAMP-binding protein